ncbi:MULTISPECIES: lipopolysaccharide biosynthesis protein [Priestia]|uniref:lipopolysaccharide biosynthesis protein n=1 Tax=Priestia megaterium TaxID=1404 RepID=UPI00188E1453|nr:lipopolysaccharide biosynthesis protein [Priestia megaterium]
MSFKKNSFWSISNMIGIQIIVLLTNIVLARLVGPDIFGLLSMATIFTNFMFVIQEAGFSSYIIYVEDLKPKLLSTSFLLNLLFSIILVLILLSLTDVIVDFYSKGEVGTIIRLAAIGLFFESISVINRAILMRQKKFKKLAIMDLSIEIIVSVFSVFLAFRGYYIFAVTAKLVIRPVLSSAILLAHNYQKLFVKPDFKLVKDILPYSNRVLGIQIFNYFNSNLDYIVIGKILGSTSLGYYSLAYNWGYLVRGYISGAVARVAFPEISANQKNNIKVEQILTMLFDKVSFFVFPITMGLFVVAPEFISGIYGDQWSQSTPILRILLISGIIGAFGSIGSMLLKAIGKPEIELKVSIVSLIVFVMCIVPATRYGIIGVCYSVLFSISLIFLVRSILIIKILKSSLKTYFYSFGLNIFSTLCMMIVVFIVKNMLDNYLTNTLVLVTSILIGVICYIGFALRFNYRTTISVVNSFYPMYLKVFHKKIS